jgi:hypothetical protein
MWWIDPPSKEGYRISKWLIISELILNRKKNTVHNSWKLKTNKKYRDVLLRRGACSQSVEQCWETCILHLNGWAECPGNRKCGRAEIHRKRGELLLLPSQGRLGISQCACHCSKKIFSGDCEWAMRGLTTAVHSFGQRQEVTLPVLPPTL